MGYAPLSNWKYDNIEVDQKVNLHRIQSGPARPRYVLVDKKNGGYGLDDVGINFALPYVDAPPVIYGSGTYDDEWRQVPLAVDGYYTNFVGSTEQLAYTVNANHARPPASGVTFNDVFVQGYESFAGNQHIANAYVPIRMGSNFNKNATG